MLVMDYGIAARGSYIVRSVPFRCIIVIGSNIGHQTQTLSDHVCCVGGVFLDHCWRVVCKCCHEFQGILSSLVIQLFILDDRNGECHQVVEQWLEHFWCYFGEINQRHEGSSQLL